MASKEPHTESDELSKSIQHVRSGHLARLTRLTREIEEAKADPSNAGLVIELQRKATVTLERFNVSSQEYAKSLPAVDMKKEMEIANRHNEAKAMLDKEIEDWLQEVHPRGTSVSRASSLHSSVSQDAERKRRKLELELNQLLRRQNAARKDEEAECIEKQKELEREEKQRRRNEEKSRRKELLDAQERLEAAQLEEELLSDGNDSEVSLVGLPNVKRKPAVFPSDCGSSVSKEPIPARRFAAQQSDDNHNVAKNVQRQTTEPPVPLNTSEQDGPILPGMNRQGPATALPPTHSSREPASGINSHLNQESGLSHTIPIYSSGTYSGNLMHPPMLLRPQPYSGAHNPPNSMGYIPQHNGDGRHPGGYSYPPSSMRYPPTTFTNQNMDRIVNSLGEMASAFRLGSDLPKPELPIFSGDPRDFCKFKHAFITSIESKTYDDSARLYYLIQHCSGKARSAIEHCSMFYDASYGLMEAKSILAGTFGQPHDIVQAYKGPLIKGPYIRAHDHTALLDLAIQMRKCQSSLNQLGFSSDINSSETLLRIVWKLPFHLQNKWASKANEIMQTQYRDPNFSDLAEFVMLSAQLANTFYGRNIRRDNGEARQMRGGNQPGRNPVRTTMLTSASNRSKLPTHAFCLYCSHPNHRLGDCFKFKAINTKERYAFASSERICHNCLLVGHLATGCLERACCAQEGCLRRHHTLFHTTPPVADINVVCNAKDEADQLDDVVEDSVIETEELEYPDLEPVELEFNVNLSNTTGPACLHVVPVRVRGNGRERVTYALLDTGSDTTLCTAPLVKSLGLQGTPTQYAINTLNSRNKVQEGSEVSLEVSSIDGKETIALPRVWTVNSIPVNRHNMPRMEDLREWPHLNGISFPRLKTDKVEILIGGNAPEAFWVLDQRVGGRKEPFAIKTLLGWTLMGPLGNKPPTKSASINHISSDHLLNDQVRAFWETDFVDINVLGKKEMSKEDKLAVRFVESSVTKGEKGYEVGLPWKGDFGTLCGNVNSATLRLKSLKRRLMKNKDLLVKYSNCIEGYLKDGHARVVPAKELEKNANEYWYLPHHPVINLEKPDKVRVVFDCAASFGGASLNKSLLSGPDVTSSLVGVLLRFRREPVALVGDIEAMFHQINVKQPDWNKLCFLWWTNGNIENDPVTCQMTKHIFGATSSPFIANYCLRKTANDNRELFDKETISTVLSSFYVDDCLASVRTAESAKTLREQLSLLLTRGGFKIKKWTSNCRDVIQSIPNEELAPSMSSIDLKFSQLPIEHTLGISWNTEKDTIGFKFTAKDKPFTKRGILSTISSVYDPMGMAAPFILKGKFILQDLTRQKFGWDDILPEKYLKLWKMWIEELPALGKVTIDRSLRPMGVREICDVQLHHFNDASTQGYGVVSYLRFLDESGNIYVKFLHGKSRLAPVKAVTIQRLELAAATLAVKLNAFIQRELELPISNTTYWTDSKTVIKYICNRTKRFHTFVSNRLAVIESGSNPNQWKYISSDDNPADEASRGMKAAELSQDNRWLSGPKFLYAPGANWPLKLLDLTIANDDPEVRRDATINIITEVDKPLTKFISHYSDWKRLLRGVCWIRRFVKFIASKQLPPANHLSADEIIIAEQKTISYVQREQFGSVADAKFSSKQLPRGLKGLNPFVSNGLLRLGGRLKHAPLDYDTKYPIIVPRGHLAKLIIQYYHQKNGHVGCSHTWSLVRKTYWIINGGAEVRRVIGKCYRCMKRNVKPSEQVMADLPQARVTPERPPFHSTGVDYFGPLTVKQARSTPKRYVCLFTCMASRAVHLEIAHDLSTASFINAFRRFISRRGCPREMYSDNGTNFVGAERELREAVNSLNNQFDFFTENNISWRFNTPQAPHMGGAWERMVGMVKRILKCILREQLVNDETLHTLLTEVEAIVNSRPLIPVVLDPDGEEPLTPRHLLLLQPHISAPGEFQLQDNYAPKRWRQVQYLAQQFWRRWVNEYIPLLQKRHKWNTSNKNLESGDIVILAEDNVPRGKWPLARVLDTYPGKDGKVRQVRVKTSSGVYDRPISKLCKLDIS